MSSEAELDWTSLLDSMAKRLDLIERAFDSGAEASVAVFELPEGIGPLPKELRETAEELLLKTQEVEKRLEAMMDATVKQLRRLPAHRGFGIGRPAATYIDQSA